MNVIECVDLTKSYRNKYLRTQANNNALDGISFQIRENSFTGLIGRNGAGKTTLMKLIAGYYYPTAGQVSVWGQDPVRSAQVTNNLICVDEKMLYPAAMCLGDIIEMAGMFYPQWDDKLAVGLFDYFQLDASQRQHNLSKGMKSTFNLIIAIAARCPLTILDEPTTGMDSAVRSDMYRALLKDYMAHPRTIILSSHLLNELDNLLEDVLLIDAGKAKLYEPITELQRYMLRLTASSALFAELEKKLLSTRLAVAGQQFVVYSEKLIGKETNVKVVKNIFNEQEVAALSKRGFDVEPVSVNEVCMLLTQKSKGGIDDVFAEYQ